MDSVITKNAMGPLTKLKLKVQQIFARNNNVASVLKVIMLVALCLFIYKKSTQSQQELDETLVFLAQPKVDDIYFLDFRVLSDSL